MLCQPHLHALHRNQLLRSLSHIERKYIRPCIKILCIWFTGPYSCSFDRMAMFVKSSALSSLFLLIAWLLLQMKVKEQNINERSVKDRAQKKHDSLRQTSEFPSKFLFLFPLFSLLRSSYLSCLFYLRSSSFYLFVAFL